MPKFQPQSKRCEVCDRVTSRYHGRQRQGALTFEVWVRDPLNGEVRKDGQTLCKECAR